MADLSITAASVVPGANAVLETATAAAAIAAGKAVYKSGSSFNLAQSTSATAGANKAYGIAVNSAAAGQPVTVQKSGEITLGAALTKGSAYYLSETAGGIEPVADLGAGENVCQIGIAKSATVLVISIQAPGAVL